jgi:hypothetical protein
MCILCEVYGTEPIEDDYELERILKVTADYMVDFPDDDVDHVMEFVNAVTGEGKDFEEDSEFVGNWERAIKDSRLTRDE